MAARKPDREIVRWTPKKRNGNAGITLAAIHESVGMTNAWDLALYCEVKGVSYSDIADLVQMVHAVRFTDTAWHLRDGCSRSVGLCLTTPVKGYSRAEWLGPQVAKVEIAAWWVARTCSLLELPIRHCTHTQIRSALRGNKRDGGVITHNDYTLATRDGNHVDPRNFPMDVCLDWARGLLSPGAYTALQIGTDTDKDDLVYFHVRLTGVGWYVLPIPTGKTSQIIKEVYISAVVDGPEPEPGWFKFWFQDDKGGVGVKGAPDGAPELTIGWNNGRSDRKFISVPDGTTQVRINYKLPASGTLGFEVKPHKF